MLHCVPTRPDKKKKDQLWPPMKIMGLWKCNVNIVGIQCPMFLQLKCWFHLSKKKRNFRCSFRYTLVPYFTLIKWRRKQFDSKIMTFFIRFCHAVYCLPAPNKPISVHILCIWSQNVPGSQMRSWALATAYTNIFIFFMNQITGLFIPVCIKS